MRRWRFRGVLVLTFCLASLDTWQAGGQAGGVSGSSSSGNVDLSATEQGEKRERATIQLIEKRPAWAQTPAVNADAELSSGRTTADERRTLPCHGVQVGAFHSLENANKLRGMLSAEFGDARIVVEERDRAAPLHRLVVGCENDRKEAQALKKKLAEHDLRGFVVEVEEDSPRTPIAEQ